MNNIKKKIDFALVFTATKCNPNGDPLDGNRPRTDIDGFGEVSDVCLKRTYSFSRMIIAMTMILTVRYATEPMTARLSKQLRAIERSMRKPLAGNGLMYAHSDRYSHSRITRSQKRKAMRIRRRVRIRIRYPSVYADLSASRWR